MFADIIEQAYKMKLSHERAYSILLALCDNERANMANYAEHHKADYLPPYEIYYMMVMRTLKDKLMEDYDAIYNTYSFRRLIEEIKKELEPYSCNEAMPVNMDQMIQIFRFADAGLSISSGQSKELFSQIVKLLT